jgi:hypothetical protein
MAALKTHDRILGLLGVMACVGAGFFLVIKMGFILHDDPQPPLIASKELTAIAVLILFAGGMAATLRIIQSLREAFSTARIRREAEKFASVHIEARRRRVVELAADPLRAKYAPLVERGEDWSDAHIAYYETPDRTATCPHLQSIERAMRSAGIEVRLYWESEVLAKCRIDSTVLERVFPLAPPVRYAEFYHAERAPHDIPTAFLICDEHKSLIHVLHPEETGANEAPLFPPEELREGQTS